MKNNNFISRFQDINIGIYIYTHMFMYRLCKYKYVYIFLCIIYVIEHSGYLKNCRKM
jgi:hypothetical protein